MKPLHIIFMIAFGLAGAFSMFELKKQPPIRNVTQLFQKFTDASHLPKNFKLYNVNDDLIPMLRRSLLLGFVAGLLYGFLMLRYLLWAIRRGKTSKEVTN